MLRLFRIIKKNFKLLIRSKASAAIIILGPLLVITLVGLAFSNESMYQIQVGSYVPNETELSEKIVGSLREKNFDVSEYDSAQGCIDGVKQGLSNICMEFSDDFRVGRDNSITIHADYSQFNLAYMIIDTVTNEVYSTATNVTTSLTSVLVQKIQSTRTSLEHERDQVVILEEDIGALDTRMDKVESLLDDQDFDFDISDFDTKNISELSETMQSRVNTLVSEMKDTLNALENDLEDYQINETEKNASLRTIRQMRSKADTMGDQFTGKDDEMQDIVEEMEDLLDDLDFMLNEDEGFRDVAYDEINAAKDLLADDLRYISALKSNYDKLLAELESIEITDPSRIASPIKTNINPIVQEKSHLSNLFPSLIVLLLMLVSLLLSSTLVVSEKKSKAFVRNHISPTRDIIFVLATYMTSLIIVLVQLILVFVAAYFFMKMGITQSLIVTSVVVLLSITFFVLLGMGIGYLIRSNEGIILASLSIGTGFLLVSGIILPLESMPQAIMDIAEFSPFVLSIDMLKKSFMFNFGFADIKDSLILLSFYSFIVFGIIMQSHYAVKRHTILQSKEKKK